jgi:hypothetical protein
LAEQLERLGRDVLECQLGDREMMGVGVERLERVAEGRANLPFDGRFAIQRNRPIEPVAKDPQIVEAEDMVGVAVREDGRVDHGRPLAQQLDPELGGRVDQEIAVRRVDQHAGARAVVFRIGRRADGTTAADDRHTDAGSRAQKNQFTGQTSAPETRSRRRR